MKPIVIHDNETWVFVMSGIIIGFPVAIGWAVYQAGKLLGVWH